MSLENIRTTIETQRLLLRPASLEDTEAFHRLYSDPETMRYWSFQPPRDLAQTRDFLVGDLEIAKQERGGFWVVELKSTHQLIGKAMLFNYSKQNRRGEIGYILDRNHWGCGIMTEALTALIDSWFDDLGLHRVEADTDVDNIGSIALLEKLGFEREGVFPERWHVYDQWQDSLMLGLLKKNWKATGPN